MMVSLLIAASQQPVLSTQQREAIVLMVQRDQMC